MYSEAETIEIVNGLRTLKIYNLKEFFEKNSEKIKNKIIKFVSELKDRKINARSLKNHFNFDEDFSAWDLSIINEKNVYKSNCFYNLAKYIAVNEILKKEKKKKFDFQKF